MYRTKVECLKPLLPSYPFLYHHQDPRGPQSTILKSASQTLENLVISLSGCWKKTHLKCDRKGPRTIC